MILRASPDENVLMNCSRQVGKSQVAGCLAILTALLQPGSTTLIVSPSMRQSGFMFRDRVLSTYRLIGAPVEIARVTALEMQLQNGSSIISLPGSEGTIRGFSAETVIIDEAAQTSQQLFESVTPFLATRRGRLVALSTPMGPSGWFYREWANIGNTARKWRRIEIKASECCRITPAFLAEERASMGEKAFAREYECSFAEVAGAVFNMDEVNSALRHDLKPLFETPPL
jgi:hypothetical protein